MSVDQREQITSEHIRLNLPTAFSGAFEDYSGVFPLGEYYRSTSINHSASGTQRHDLYLGGGAGGVSVRLQDQTTSEYPLNQVNETQSGHVIEMDDTPGNQRVLIRHNSGSGIELRNNGDVLVTTGPGGQRVEVVHGNSSLLVEGEGSVVYNGNLNLRVVGDYNLDVQGNFNVNVAGNLGAGIAGSSRQTIGGNMGTVVTGTSSTTVAGQTTNTHLGGVSNNVRGAYSNNVDGDAGFFASGQSTFTAEGRVNISSPDVNMAASNLSVFGDAGTIGGENIIMYNYNMHTGHSVWAGETVETQSIHATRVDASSLHGYFVGDLQGTAENAASGGGPFIPQSAAANVAADITATYLPSGALLNSYLNRSAGGVRRVSVDDGDFIRNAIDQTTATGGLSSRPVTTGRARSQLRDPAARSNAQYVNNAISTQAICENYNNPTPEGIGRIFSSSDGVPSSGSTSVGTSQSIQPFIPRRPVTVRLLPDVDHNPLSSGQPITSSTRLASNITMARFLGTQDDPTTLNHIRDENARQQLAKYYYLHARIMQTILEDNDAFANYTLAVTEGLYRPGPQETITAGSLNELKSVGRAVAYVLLDASGQPNLTKLVDLVVYWKDTINFDRMILSYDTIDCVLNGRVIIVLPEINDNWEGTYNFQVTTELNNHLLSQGEIVEVLPQANPSSYSAVPSGQVGEGYSGTIRGDVAGLDARLVDLLETAAEQTGLNVVVSSGNRGAGGSGRHNGYAADIMLYDGETLLDLNNGPSSRDTGLIRDYIGAFINNARARGLVPSAGAGNNEGNYYHRLYMRGIAVHVDIARTPGIGARLAGNAGPYWGGSEETAHVPPPSWLVSLF